MIRTVLALIPPGYSGFVRRFTILTVVSVIIRAASVVFLVPLLSGLFDGDHDKALLWLGALTVSTAVGWIVDRMISTSGFGLGFGIVDNAQRDVAERLSRVRLTWFNAANTADARQAIAATGPDLAGLVVYLVVPVAGAVLLPAVIGIVLFPVAWQLALVALAGVPLLLGAQWATTAITKKADAVADEANAELNGRVIEFARTQEALRVSRRAEPERSLVGDALDRQHGALTKLLMYQIPGQVLFSLASQVALFALAGTAAWLTVRGDLSPAESVALIVVAVRYLEPFTVLAELGAGLETTRLTLRRIGSVLDAETDGPQEGSALTSNLVASNPVGAPRIEFENVTFGYGRDHPILENLNLTIEAGSATAIVGASGSGKSTILGLIAGLHEPRAGRILFDGVDVAKLELPARRALSSVVFQEPYLIQGTIEENVLAGDPSAGPDRVAAATRLARVDEIVSRLPDGLRAPVGEGGSVLSGGERQRISIARALLKPAPVLLIDEATSALDNENERAVVDALSTGGIPRTRIIVAHRKAGIRRADQVIVIDDGRIAEQGAPAELLAAGGLFARFWEHQEAGAGWKLTDR
ncbi:ATP-binding cassette domain-containing protein [Gordonia pseudamarae]|uniref:ATP-binding cassette domain-containing protein n=1 Tax=Gordonia pseudamarae TaxID=2831662 RepID=A0ABX6ICM4_9ACTN|nr:MULTISPECIES: ABC transporter ATP-binding protein [Gordonia]MBD0022891.1 ABC transporter ATP-binding protein [Gordonia sp. (in: high G+C Gram-positive bacteria)]QHN24751.1 ATP-binding cassette domain-containing protein [Gordonia pseudamarae]QHN33683.1 ATP-binding cassette domain-containing protein [Gordonia pseudamarae]